MWDEIENINGYIVSNRYALEGCRKNVTVWLTKILDHFLYLFRQHKSGCRTRAINFFLNKCKKIYTK